MNFTGFCLLTSDVQKLLGFYQNILRVSGEGDQTHATVNVNGCSFAIFSLIGMEELAPGSMGGTGCGRFTLDFEVDDVDQEYQRLQQLNVAVIKPPRTHEWGRRSMWFWDPDGNIVNFYSRIR